MSPKVRVTRRLWSKFFAIVLLVLLAVLSIPDTCEGLRNWAKIQFLRGL